MCKRGKEKKKDSCNLSSSLKELNPNLAILKLLSSLLQLGSHGLGLRLLLIGSKYHHKGVNRTCNHTLTDLSDSHLCILHVRKNLVRIQRTINNKKKGGRSALHLIYNILLPLLRAINVM